MQQMSPFEKLDLFLVVMKVGDPSKLETSKATNNAGLQSTLVLNTMCNFVGSIQVLEVDNTSVNPLKEARIKSRTNVQLHTIRYTLVN